MSALVVTPQLAIPLDEFEFSYARSSGPGGQNVNKVNTKALLRWPVRDSPSLPPDVRARFLARFGGRLTLLGEILITGQRFRDVGRNRSDCLDKLRKMLEEVASPAKLRKRTKPSRGAVRRRLTTKRQQSEKKQSRRGGADE
ncbi:MAG: alternative ribosome rescue aminoacyl-tRNA hydrolase ArfB [Thermoguttaceae bacterium]